MGKLSSSFVLFGLLAVLGACSSEAKLGEECDDPGKTEDVCESGGICGKTSSGALVCLKVCVDQPECADTEDCNGVEGSNLKACRPKSGSGSGTGTGGGTGTGTGGGDGKG